MQMDNRLSELQNEEVDYLRFDRIKIQRKRMEHILEVIKDLTFKNKELIKQNTQLKQEYQQDRHYKRLYEEIIAEKKIWLQKNHILGGELQNYRETALHQEIIINSLRDELYHTQLQCKFNPSKFMLQSQNYHTCCDQNKGRSIEQQDHSLMQEYLILKTQYSDLQEEYSKLYKKIYTSKQKENCQLTGHIYKGGQTRAHAQQLLNNAKDTTNVKEQSINDLKLRAKYDRLKQTKKELSRQIKKLQGQMSNMKEREIQFIQLIDLFKEKKTKICLCHINKLQKHLSQPHLEEINSIQTR